MSENVNTVNDGIHSKGGRLLALDAIRGLAVLGMILVVSPGSWGHRLSFLDHASWHGYTPADLVFPLFLFSVGVAMALGGSSSHNKLDATIHVARRVGLLILLGLFLNLLPSFDFSSFRIPGILQRIALCYGIAAITIILFSAPGGQRTPISNKTVVVAILLLLVAWQLLLSFTSAPGFPVGDISQGGTLASWVDRKVFTTSHLWAYGTDSKGVVVYDPEGLLATFPATINVFIGILLLNFLGRNPESKTLGAAAFFGVSLVLVGHIADHYFLINKQIWTSSFALVSSGWAIFIYSAIVVLLRLKMVRAFFLPMMILGGNAILAFSLSQVFGAYAYTQIGGDTPQGFFFNFFNHVVGNAYLASFICSLLVLSTIIIMIYPLYKKSINIRF